MNIILHLLQSVFEPRPGESSKVIHKLPPPPLHVVRLGGVNHLVNCLMELWPPLQVCSV